jgi:hypothetical protein
MVGNGQNVIPQCMVQVNHGIRIQPAVAPGSMGMEIGFILLMVFPVDTCIRVVDFDAGIAAAKGNGNKGHYK